MKNTRLTRLAATGAATALASAALVGSAASTADAAVSGSASYTCPTGLPLPGLESLTVPVEIATDAIAGELPARTDLGGAVPVTGVVTAPENLVSALLGLLGVSQLGAQLPDFALGLGEQSVPVGAFEAPLTALAPGAVGLPVEGVISSLSTPELPGTYDLTMPESFSLVPVAGAPLPIQSLTCSLAEGSDPVISQVTVTKSGSSITGRTAETKKGHKAVASVRRAVGGDVFGKVVAKLGKKTVGSKAVSKRGKAVFALPKSAHGKKLTLVYKGDSATTGSRTSVTVR